MSPNPSYNPYTQYTCKQDNIFTLDWRNTIQCVLSNFHPSIFQRILRHNHTLSIWQDFFSSIEICNSIWYLHQTLDVSIALLYTSDAELDKRAPSRGRHISNCKQKLLTAMPFLFVLIFIQKRTTFSWLNLKQSFIMSICLLRPDFCYQICVQENA